jgi:hypothetical protein
VSGGCDASGDQPAYSNDQERDKETVAAGGQRQLQAAISLCKATTRKEAWGQWQQQQQQQLGSIRLPTSLCEATTKEEALGQWQQQQQKQQQVGSVNLTANQPVKALNPGVLWLCWSTAGETQDSALRTVF